MSFLLAYKKVDNLIKDAYSSETGVTRYIDELDSMRYQKWYGISWEDTYKQLKHYRYIRNQIVHDDNITEEDLCSDFDEKWLQRFYNDLLNGKDPLSLRANKLRETITPIKQPRADVQSSRSQDDETSASFFKKVSNFFKRLFKNH